MDIVAQWVRTSWTKQSRGGLAAARRNAAPVGFALPSTRVPIVHTVTMDEPYGFQPDPSVRDGLPDADEVQLKEVDGRVRVHLVAQSRGMSRRSRRPPAVWRERGQWVRWQVNYRFTYADGSWRYRLDTLNLAYGSVPTDVFTGTATRSVDERAHLR